MHRLINKAHKILGVLLSIFVFMWCVSGIVMIYHTFPRITSEVKNQLAFTMDSCALPPLESVVAHLDRSKKIKRMRLVKLFPQEAVFSVEQEGKNTFLYLSDGVLKESLISFEKIALLADRWSDAAIVRVDTLHSADMWVIGTRMDHFFPLYKFYFADSERSELYLSARSGEAVQCTDKYSRFWSYLGPIPHWLYVPKMREKKGTSWRLMGQIVSGLSAVTVLLGIVVAGRVVIRYNRRLRTLRSPYKKRWQRWHYLYGLAFGGVLLLFLFSGFISFSKVPLWLVKEHQPRALLSDFCRNQRIMENESADYRQLLATFSFVEPIKSLDWIPFGEQLFCQVQGNHGAFLVDMDHPSIRVERVDSAALVAAVRTIQPEREILEVVTLDRYDACYIARKGDLPLPVYRIRVDDLDHSTYYIDPKTLYCKYFNNNLTLSRHLYHGIHRIEFPWSINHPVAREVVEILLVLFCSFLSLTGLVVSYHYLRRRKKRH